MFKLVFQIMRWIPEMRKQLILAGLFKFLESVFMGLPYGFVFLTLNETLTGALTHEKIIYYSLGIAICFLFQFAFSYLFYGAVWPAANTVAKELRLKVGAHMRSLPLGYYSKEGTGKLHTLVVDEVQSVQRALFITFPEFIVAGTFIFIAPFFFVAVDWRLTLAMVSIFPVAAPVYYWGQKVFGECMVEHSDFLAKVNAQIIEYVQGIEVLKAFTQVDGRLGKIAGIIKDFRTHSIRTVAKGDAPLSAGRVLLDVGICVVLLVSTRLLFSGTADLLSAIMFLVWSLRVYEPVKRLIPGMIALKMAEPGMRKIDALFNSEPLSEPKNPQSPSGADVVFDNVTFTYDTEESTEPALTNVSFTVPEGTMTALVGPSGSGKTTITRLISRFWDVDSGSVKVGGVDVRDMQIDTLLSRLSMVFQDVYLFNDTIYNNIAFGTQTPSPKAVMAAAKTAQCHEFISDLPDGYKTMVGEGGSSLSGGEKQRVSIARAMIKDAPVLLLDEATASVDPGNEYLIQDALNALIGSKTLVVIAHRLSTIVAADQIVVLNDKGRVEEVGDHATLLAKNGLYARLWHDRSRSRQWRISGSPASKKERQTAA